MIEEQVNRELEDAMHKAMSALENAQRAWYKYAVMCDVGPDRVRAFDVYQNLMNATRR